MPRFKLGYWKIRGLAQSNRILLSMCDADWEDVWYEQGDAPSFDVSCWTQVKYKLGCDFPNLPYLIDEAKGVRLSQSMAITRYIASQVAPELLAPNSDLAWAVDMLADQEVDLRSALVAIYYRSKSYEEAKESFAKSVPSLLQGFEDFLGKTKPGPFLVGPLSLPDLYLAEHLDQMVALFPGSLDNYPRLTAYHKAFFSLPKVQEFVAKYPKLPINNKSAFLK